jgi:hypothetical protein
MIYPTMRRSKAVLKSGLLVATICAALTAQQHRQSGEVVFTNGESKPFSSLGCAAGYGGWDTCDIDGVAVRYSEDLKEIFDAVDTQKALRLPEMDLKGLIRLELLPFSKEDHSIINNRIGCVEKGACTIRKASLTFSTGKKRSNLFLYLSRLEYAIGPEKRLYDLRDYDIAAVIIRR